VFLTTALQILFPDLLQPLEGRIHFFTHVLLPQRNLHFV
jgi:hypothetical protein